MITQKHHVLANVLQFQQVTLVQSKFRMWLLWCGSHGNEPLCALMKQDMIEKLAENVCQRPLVSFNARPCDNKVAIESFKKTIQRQLLKNVKN